ncbi:MAG: dTMP kinase [Proteobacteria bacterium]|nr:dTMP kinase [Pseudomonadota bacterium]
MTRGRFITLEGIDGAGKSTHVPALQAAIAARGCTVVATREPGGTPLGEKLRELLLHEPMTADAETLLMFAARQEHVATVVRPALERGDWVLCDRFTDATYAYQGGGKAVDPARLDALAGWVHGDCHPDLTLLFDVPLAVSRARLASAQAAGRVLDRFELERDAFAERVRETYLARAAAEPRRFRIVDSTQPPAAVEAQLRAWIAELS